MLASLLIKTVIWLALMAALLFVPAGTIAWPQAWVFLIEMVATGVLITGLALCPTIPRCWRSGWLRRCSASRRPGIEYS